MEEGQPDRAISAYRRALRIDDTRAEAHNDLGTAYYEKGLHAEAEACFRRAIELQPGHGIACANLGAALRAQGRVADARRAFQRALLLKLRGLLPEFLQWRLPAPGAAAPAAGKDAAAQLLHELSVALLAGDAAQAGRLAAQGEERFPRHPDVLYLAASVREEAVAFDEALALVERAIAIKSERAEYHVVHARLLLVKARADEALAAARKALSLEPGSADAHAVHSAALRGAGRMEEAEQAARRAIELDAASHAGHSSLSATLWLLGRLEEAEKHAREALRLTPRSVHFQLNLAVILKDAGRNAEARELYRAAVDKVPAHPGLLLNMGTLALQCEGDVAAARRWYARSNAIGADAKVTLSEAILDLFDGDYAAAWPKYEARRLVTGHRERHAPFAAWPDWDGEPMGERRLFVYGEQGLGDEVMFASMLPEVHARAPRATLACDSRLATLFARSFPGFDVMAVPPDTVPKGAPGHDAVAALGSLGRHFRRSPSDFPPHRGYLRTDPEKVARWRERLAALGAPRRIGISWSGGTVSTGLARRSVELQQLLPLLRIPGTAWVSLQYGKAALAAAPFAREQGVPLHAYEGIAEDLDEFASVVDALDLVVSVCNTTVHIAGALGKEVLVMAPLLPEWRYGLHGEHMAWYPSARVYRQDTMDQWEGVIAQVKRKLQP